MYFMHEIIVSLANHDIPEKLLPNCGMWALASELGSKMEVNEIALLSLL
jgi:hypothetical protein